MLCLESFHNSRIVYFASPNAKPKTVAPSPLSTHICRQSRPGTSESSHAACADFLDVNQIQSI